MKNYGTTQRRYGAEAPQMFEKSTRKVCIDIQPCQYTQEEEVIDGYSWIEIYLGEGSMDYGAVKSKLIEAAFPPKDEFGLLMNAIMAIIDTLSEEQKEQEDIAKIASMNEWRGICAQTARQICMQVGTLI